MKACVNCKLFDAKYGPIGVFGQCSEKGVVNKLYACDHHEPKTEEKSKQ